MNQNQTAILFDLDGTLLPMDYQRFTQTYLELLAAYAAPLGYKPKPMIAALWEGAASIVGNDGSRTNREAFWETFAQKLGDREKVLGDMPAFDRFYRCEFDQAKKAVGENPLAREAVALARQRADQVILATMPQFPLDAIATRLRWIGLAPEDFDLVTSYENSCYSKPNPAYYTDLLARQGIHPGRALMIGNDPQEDIRAAGAAGLNTYLVTDWKMPGEVPPGVPQGTFGDLLDYLRSVRL